VIGFREIQDGEVVEFVVDQQPAAVGRDRARRLEPGGVTGTVRTCPPLPTRSAMTQCSSRFWSDSSLRASSSPTVFTVENGAMTHQSDVEWAAPDALTLGAWNNSIDATEMGSYACVIAAVELSRGFFAVRRAETGTGADYYTGPLGSGVDDLENCCRLEVSGVDAGNDRDVRQRVLQKVEQARRGESSLPAVAGVIGFAARLIVLADAEVA
jgi:hypothetical protein